jgi:hypothetical protein
MAEGRWQMNRQIEAIGNCVIKTDADTALQGRQIGCRDGALRALGRTGLGFIFMATIEETGSIPFCSVTG